MHLVISSNALVTNLKPMSPGSLPVQKTLSKVHEKPVQPSLLHILEWMKGDMLASGSQMKHAVMQL